MLMLQSDIHNPLRLAFSPDGLALVAMGNDCVQVWPQWLDRPPKPVFKTQSTLERIALSSDGTLLFEYLSGNSRTRVLTVDKSRDAKFGVPEGPAWFHFTPEVGFIIVSHASGKLSRFDFAPKTKKRVRKVWTVNRPTVDPEDDEPTTLGSHYSFGNVCGPAGVFVAQEYRFGGDELTDGIAVRSVEDGALIHREVLKESTANALVDSAGLKMAIHPSGQYFAYPRARRILFRSLSTTVKVPKEIAYLTDDSCRAVAFHPGGTILAAVGTDESVKLFDTATWKMVRSFAWEIGELRAVCFSLDGTRAATIGKGAKKIGGKVVVWDVDL
ncbi:MAG: hypothetical protein L0241_19820 [Planctomycetia bacterium]|nr:hypothetical protein [Planctomycetia bacterium]